MADVVVDTAKWRSRIAMGPVDNAQYVVRRDDLTALIDAYDLVQKLRTQFKAQWEAAYISEQAKLVPMPTQEIHLHCEGQDKLQATLDAVFIVTGRILAEVSLNGVKMDKVNHTQAEVVADLQQLLKQSGDYIASRDAIDATKDATIKDLTAKLAADEITLAAAQDGINAAFDAAEQAKALLLPPAATTLPAPVPVADPGPALIDTLAASYPTQFAFSQALLAYTGPDAVTVDANPVRAGNGPALAYFSHSQTGVIDTSGPTD